VLTPPYDLVDAKAHRHHQFSAGQTVFRQEEKTRGLFVVLEGEVELQRFTREGDRVTIHRARKAETFAEASLFSTHYHCDAIAIVNSRLVELDRATVLQQFHDDPGFAAAVAGKFARQLQNYRRKIELFSIRGAEERILMAMREGIMGDDIKSFAFEIGLTHEVVYRGLAKLVAKGKLKKTGRGKFALKPAG